MAIVEKLDQAFVDRQLQCVDGKARCEFVDPQRTGLYIEVRATSPGHGTFWLRYKDRAGKTCHQKIGRTADISLAEARRRAKELKAEIQLGADPRGELKAKKAVPTLAAFFEDSYLPHVKPRLRSWKKLESLFRLHVAEVFGHKRLNELNRRDFQVFHADLLKKNLKEASCDHALKLARQVLNKAVEWEVIAVNPIARIRLFNPDNRSDHHLETADLQKLLAVLHSDENRPVCNVALLLLSTGARLNEALSAKWEHIDRENKVWRIPALNSKNRRIRSVPLNESALAVLDQLGSEGNSSGFLFISGKTHEPLGYIHKVWNRLRKEAGLPTLKLHSLRSSFASFLVNSGRSLYEVQKLLGHSSHSVTERYAWLNQKSLMDASNTASVVIESAMPKAVQEAATEVATTAVEDEVTTAA